MFRENRERAGEGTGGGRNGNGTKSITVKGHCSSEKGALTIPWSPPTLGLGVREVLTGLLDLPMLERASCLGMTPAHFLILFFLLRRWDLWANYLRVMAAQPQD